MLRSPFSPLITLTIPFCAIARSRAYPKCSILECLLLTTVVQRYQITPRQISPPWRFPPWCCSGFYSYTISPSMREYPNTIASHQSHHFSRHSRASGNPVRQALRSSKRNRSDTYEQAWSVRFPPKAEARSSSGPQRLRTSLYWLFASSGSSRPGPHE
jgi:hypothetical protein